MKKLYYDQDANWDLMLDRKVAIIGYGSQGHAHALNLKESGVDVTVGLYKGSKSWNKATAEGLKVAPVAEATAGADIVMILIPMKSRLPYTASRSPRISNQAQHWLSPMASISISAKSSPPTTSMCS